VLVTLRYVRLFVDYVCSCICYTLRFRVYVVALLRICCAVLVALLRAMTYVTFVLPVVAIVVLPTLDCYGVTHVPVHYRCWLLLLPFVYRCYVLLVTYVLVVTGLPVGCWFDLPDTCRYLRLVFYFAVVLFVRWRLRWNVVC